MLSVFIFIFVGVLATSFASSVYKRAKLSDLRDKGKLFIASLENEFELSGNIQNDRVNRLHSDFSGRLNLDIYVYDENGACILSDKSYDSDTFAVPFEADNDSSRVRPLSDSKMDELNDGAFLSSDSTSFSASEPSLIYGTKKTLRSRYSDYKQKIYVICYTDMGEINSFNIKVSVFYALIVIAAVLGSSFLMRKHMKKAVEYESKFQQISEKFSKGDFSERIPANNTDNIQSDIAKYVNSLADAVENSDSTSKTFIANVSHELRTPITTVIGFVDGILDGTIPKSRQNEYLVLVSKETHRLKILISSMLNMTKFESGTMTPNFRDTNLTDLVIQTVLMFEKKIEDKKLEVEGLDSDRLVAVADTDLMQQVIYNLVENAVKFVNEGGTLSFRFEKTNGINIIGIRNTGEGLKNDEIQQVFDRFYKTDSSRGKDTTGLGLGLSISRKIVHLHNGHIVVKSVYGEYTEFQIQIPDIKPNRKD